MVVGISNALRGLRASLPQREDNSLLTYKEFIGTDFLSYTLNHEAKMSAISSHTGYATSTNTDNPRPLDGNTNQVTLHPTRRNAQSPTRRFWHWPSILATASIASLVAPVCNLATGLLYAPDIPDPTDYLGRARHILKTTPLIDGHNDLPYLVQVELQNKIYSGFNLSNRLLGHTDLTRMREGQMGGQFWSIYIDCEQINHVDDPTVGGPRLTELQTAVAELMADVGSRLSGADRCGETLDSELHVRPGLL